MKLWLFSHNFPPEVNACANRSYEHSKYWARDGVEVEVFTDTPHFPEGKVYAGYKNRYSVETVDGVTVHRCPSYIAANKRRIRRILSYLTFMVSSMFCSLRMRRKPDIILGTSPQIFTTIAAWLVSEVLRKPFVIEVRDLWPQSIRAVGAIKTTVILNLIYWMVGILYQRAKLVIIVSEGFREEIRAQGVPDEKIFYVPNGIDLEMLPSNLTARKSDDRFVVSYIGTTGMAHGLEVIINAARECDDTSIHFMIVGTGACWDELKRRSEELPNCTVTEKVSRDEALRILACSDVSLIHLKKSPVFHTVIPSKMFEAMALSKPIILGVQGEAAKLLASSEAGIAFTPESATELLAAVATLKSQGCGDFGQRGLDFVKKNFSRESLARTLMERCRTLMPDRAPQDVKP